MIDYGAIAEYDDAEYFTYRARCDNDCKSRCSSKAQWDPNFKNAAFLCSKIPSQFLNVPLPVPIVAWWKVATEGWSIGLKGGTLAHFPAVTKSVCTCPKGTKGDKWVDGGVTTDGKCTWVAVDGLKPFPGTSLPKDGNVSGDGNWFKYGAFIGQAVKPNCVTTVITPSVCKWK